MIAKQLNAIARKADKLIGDYLAGRKLLHGCAAQSFCTSKSACRAARLDISGLRVSTQSGSCGRREADVQRQS